MAKAPGAAGPAGEWEKKALVRVGGQTALSGPALAMPRLLKSSHGGPHRGLYALAKAEGQGLGVGGSAREVAYRLKASNSSMSNVR